MKILFVTIRSGLGGIETLIMRMVSYLESFENIKVSVLLISKGKNVEFLNSIESKCNIYYAKDIFKIKNDIKNQKFDVIYSFGIFSLLFSIFLKKFFLKTSKISFGVYHPLEYCWKSGPNSYVRKISHEIMKSFPLENIFFMNEGAKEKHEIFIERNFSNSPIFPLPIDFNRMKHIKRCPKKNKIISVGRIVDFKTYIFHMVDICCEFNKKNINQQIEFHIYGDGNLMEKLINYINEKSATQFIFTYGSIEYSKIENVFEEAFIFIGCGTALIEASAAGVPSLISITSSQSPDTYGYFYETNGYNIGEVDNNTTRYMIYDKIYELCNKNKEEYLKIERLCQEKASLFSIENIIYDFLEKLKNTKDFKPNISVFGFFRITLSFIFWKFIEKVGIKSTFSSRYFEDTH